MSVVVGYFVCSLVYVIAYMSFNLRMQYDICVSQISFMYISRRYLIIHKVRCKSGASNLQIRLCCAIGCAVDRLHFVDFDYRLQ